jgi:hypothetical protein
MASISREKQTISSESKLSLSKKKTFCSDCVIEWCKNRDKVTYCTLKYKGTRCYSCDNNSCRIKRLAGS